MTGRSSVGTDWHTCHGSNCRGKRAYHTRRGAKVALRSHPDRHSDKTEYRTALTVYRCPHDHQNWHIGHKPLCVVRGHVARIDFSAGRAL